MEYPAVCDLFCYDMVTGQRARIIREDYEGLRIIVNGQEVYRPYRDLRKLQESGELMNGVIAKVRKYREILADIKELELEKEEIEEEIIGISAAPQGEKTSSTNKFRSKVENQVITQDKKTRDIETLINKKKREIKRIDNAMTILKENEREIIQTVHIEHRNYYIVQDKLRITYPRVKQIEKQAAQKMAKYLRPML